MVFPALSQFPALKIVIASIVDGDEWSEYSLIGQIRPAARDQLLIPRLCAHLCLSFTLHAVS